MREDGVRRGLAFTTSAFGSYSGCRQYREDIERARTEVGPDAPEIHKLRTFHNHPGFIAAAADRVRARLCDALSQGGGTRPRVGRLPKPTGRNATGVPRPEGSKPRSDGPRPESPLTDRVTGYRAGKAPPLTA